MTISFLEAKKAVRRGQRSANHAIDAAHAASQKRLTQARELADDVIDVGDKAAQSTGRALRSAHDWMEEKPHLAALAALAAGIVLGAMLSRRR
jgi:ElaB/YqjD/DUF883 family membrane-anchored ribosome-binding protein